MIRITPYDNMPNPRATGRTFRRLLRAFIAASEGHHVTYVVHNKQMVRWTFNQAMDIIKDTLNWHHIKDNRDFKIEFPNGSVEFVDSNNYRERNQRGLVGMQFKVVRDED